MSQIANCHNKNLFEIFRPCPSDWVVESQNDIVEIAGSNVLKVIDLFWWHKIPKAWDGNIA